MIAQWRNGCKHLFYFKTKSLTTHCGSLSIPAYMPGREPGMGEDGNLYHYAAGVLVGVIVLNASHQGMLASTPAADE